MKAKKIKTHFPSLSSDLLNVSSNDRSITLKNCSKLNFPLVHLLQRYFLYVSLYFVLSFEKAQPLIFELARQFHL